MKATEQYFPVVLFTMLYKVPLMYESMDEILLSEKSNYQAVLSYGSVFIMRHKVAQSVWVSGWLESYGFDKLWAFKRKLLSSTFVGENAPEF